VAIGFPRRDDPHYTVFRPIAVAYEKEPKRGAEAQQDKPVFRQRVVRIVDQDRLFVQEGRRGLSEGDTMAPLIQPFLRRVPVETKVVRHTLHCSYILPRKRGRSNDIEFSGERSESAATSG